MTLGVSLRRRGGGFGSTTPSRGGVRLGAAFSPLVGLIVATLLGACSGRSSHNGPPSGAAGEVSAGTGGQGGSGGIGASGRGGEGGVGQGGAGSNRFPCGMSQPVLDPSTGLEQCSGGFVRRTAPASCPSTIPRTAAVSGYNEELDECQFDTDCRNAAVSYAHCGVRQGGFAHVCVAGCVEDADCTSGNVCLCGDPVGRCVPATCSTGADCVSGFDCAAYQAQPGCFSAEFACQAPGDTCASDADCTGFSPNPAFCHVENGTRACTIAQCTTP